MATRFTKEDRQAIVQEFAVRHNGQYDPRLFLDEVRSKGKDHPAFDWFEWDANTAALAYQIEQARSFARDLRVTFTIEEVTAPHSVRLVQKPMPMVISPMLGRHKGGGYVLTDVADPNHIIEHCHQAARTLEQWFNRYEASLAYVGLKKFDIDKIVGKLENARPKKAA